MKRTVDIARKGSRVISRTNLFQSPHTCTNVTVTLLVESVVSCKSILSCDISGGH